MRTGLRKIQMTAFPPFLLYNLLRMKLLAFALLSFALQVSSASTGKPPAAPSDSVQKINATYRDQNSGTRANRGETLVAQSAAPSFESTSKSQTADTSGNRRGEPTQTVKVSELPP